MKVIAAAVLLLGLVAPAWATEISGPATVVDADVITINGTTVMLFGLESVERKQICSADGREWDCWTAAVRQLQTLVDQGPVTCTTEREPDPYGRVLGRCVINGQSLNEALVRSGFAVAKVDETKDYVDAEKAAKAEKAGLWQGKFDPPKLFRLKSGIFVDRP